MKIVRLSSEIGKVENQTAEEEHCAQMTSYGLYVTFVFIKNMMTWTDAQSFCRANYTDLASVRNMSENQKIKELIPKGKKAWIGLFRDSWKWIDGSSSSFRYWDTKEPNNNFHKEMCVAAYFGKEGKWEDWNCDYKRAFVCYSGKSSNKFKY
uniref:C-type lectin domain-containing protein n=1 Tax=Maylandia zebra TaxID=106582 RepID=A0A3P9DNU3_9CICH